MAQGHPSEQRLLSPSPIWQERPLRRFMVGHLASSLGTRMAYAGVLWHVYELTASPILLGSVGLTQLLPVLIIGPLGGVLADHFDRRTLLLWTQPCKPYRPCSSSHPFGCNHGGTFSDWYLCLVCRAWILPPSVDSDHPPTEHLGGAMALADMVRTAPSWRTRPDGIRGRDGLDRRGVSAQCSLVCADGQCAGHASTIEPTIEPTGGFAPVRPPGSGAVHSSPMVWALLVLDFGHAVCVGRRSASHVCQVLQLDVGEYGLLASGVAVGAPRPAR